MMNKQTLKQIGLVAIMILLTFFIGNCGGGGNEFDALLDLTPMDELIGDWEIEGRVTNYTCTYDGETVTEETDGEGMFSSFYNDITITTDTCTVDEGDFIDVEDGEEMTEQCAAGNDQVMMEQSASSSADDCNMTASTAYSLTYDEETDTLVGTFSASFSVSGTCDDESGESHSVNCQMTGTATGTNSAVLVEPDDNVPEDDLSTTEDNDGDGLVDASDNCPENYNPLQVNTDGDAWGNVCELEGTGLDDDADGWEDSTDNCPDTFNEDQADSDGDGTGDACAPAEIADSDGDGIKNDTDNCLYEPNADQLDDDGDTLGNACEADSDDDGIIDDSDNCDTAPNLDQSNIDGDELGDACDEDRDGDNLCDSEGSVLCTDIDPNHTKRTSWYYVDTSITTSEMQYLIAGTYLYYSGTKDDAGNIVVDGLLAETSEHRTLKRCPGNETVETGICVLEEATMIQHDFSGLFGH